MLERKACHILERVTVERDLMQHELQMLQQPLQQGLPYTAYIAAARGASGILLT